MSRRNDKYGRNPVGARGPTPSRATTQRERPWYPYTYIEPGTVDRMAERLIYEDIRRAHREQQERAAQEREAYAMRMEEQGRRARERREAIDEQARAYTAAYRNGLSSPAGQESRIAAVLDWGVDLGTGRDTAAAIDAFQNEQIRRVAYGASSQRTVIREGGTIFLEEDLCDINGRWIPAGTRLNYVITEHPPVGYPRKIEPHKDAGKVVKSGRVKRTILGVPVDHVRQPNGGLRVIASHDEEEN